ncbi:hypothetical protein HS960_05450 [Sphingobacterium paramultivorum]|uniref:Uncharacterized protein n=1 Tax=Sphingobacterium paramultivorum TaxID=2886510 RepID=A0A7G5DZF8_9SPHI|nr:hypothetical protein [Sphingobacterium paramultivorum]QMV67133.1 hypothetical protein HS960_05450 [Sphingobacterium paramultivorum]WSO15980.1 hypothetical protein VUL84_05420 [Sphingobacterium paramultivorum]
MGTTQRINPGVTNQPNWGDLSNSITQVAKTLEQEKTLDEEEAKKNDKKEDDSIKHLYTDSSKQYKKIVDRRTEHIRTVFKNLIRTGGGRQAIASGKSSSIGKAGLKSAGKLTGFFTSVATNGLDKTLVDIGFGSLQGKSFNDIIDYLLVYCSESNQGMDETAANKASCEIMKEIAAQSDNNVKKYQDLIKQLVDGQELSDTLCKFWGLYIFEHLSQRFEEKIQQQKGEDVSKETFKIIKDDILGRVKVLNTQRAISKIDWNKAEGKKEIEKIFDSIIKIICNEKN